MLEQILVKRLINPAFNAYFILPGYCREKKKPGEKKRPNQPAKHKKYKKKNFNEVRGERKN